MVFTTAVTAYPIAMNPTFPQSHDGFLHLRQDAQLHRRSSLAAKVTSDHFIGRRCRRLQLQQPARASFGLAWKVARWWPCV